MQYRTLTMIYSIQLFFLFFTSIVIGKSWEIYNIENSDIPTNDLSNITIDSSDNLWFYTNNSVFMYNQTENIWTEYNEHNSNLTSDFRHIEIGFDGSVNIASDGIYKYNSYNNEFEIKEKNISSSKFTYDRNGILYYLRNGLIYKKDGENINNVYDGTIGGPNYPTDLVIDVNNILWFSVDGFTRALYSYDGFSLDTLDSIFKANPRIGIISISLDNKSNLWLGNGSDCVILNYSIDNQDWKYFGNSNSPLGEKGMFSKDSKIDKNNNLWVISSISNAIAPINLYKYDGLNWSEFSIDEGLDIKKNELFTMYAVEIDSKGNVWIPTDNGLVKFNENTTSVTTSILDKIKIYPNPAKTNLNFDLGGEIVKSITITDLNGKEVITYNSELSNLNSIDISTLITGQYFISFELTDKSVINKKFVKE